MDKELIERFVNSTGVDFFGNNTVDLNMPDTVNLPYLRSTIMPAAIPNSADDWIDTCMRPLEDIKEHVNHPSHYGGEDNIYEAIKVIEAWDLGFCLGNAIKYISRAGKKDNNSYLQDLKKAKWYLEREIAKFEV